MKNFSILKWIGILCFLPLSCQTFQSNLSCAFYRLDYHTVATIEEFDYAPEFRELLSGTRILGLGEANHGTLEFTQIKCSIVQHLVQHQHFRHIIMEVGYPQARAVNAYLHGDSVNLRRIMFMYFPWPFATQGFLDLLQWLRDFNSRQAENTKVNFYGMDIQGFRSVASMRHELNIFGKITGVHDSSIVQKLENITGNEIEKDKQLKRLLYEYSKNQYINQADSLALRNIIETQININIKHGGRRYKDRESILFEYASQSIQANPESEKFIIWAHNDHVSRKYSGRESLGEKLFNHYGSIYKAVGFEYHSGGFRAYHRESDQDSTPFKIFNPEPAPLTLGFRLGNLNKGVMGISLLKKKNQSFGSKKIYINSVGASYTHPSGKNKNLYIEKIKAGDSFDYLIIVKKIHPSESLR